MPFKKKKKRRYSLRKFSMPNTRWEAFSQHRSELQDRLRKGDAVTHIPSSPQRSIPGVFPSPSPATSETTRQVTEKQRRFCAKESPHTLVQSEDKLHQLEDNTSPPQTSLQNTSILSEKARSASKVRENEKNFGGAI